MTVEVRCYGFAEDPVLRGYGVAQRERRPLASAGDVNGMVLCQRIVLVDFLEPVGTRPRTALYLFILIGDKGSPIVRSQPFVETAFVLDSHVLFGREHGGHLIGILPSHKRVIVKGSLSGFTLLGGNKDNPVCRPCTVDGGRSSVLEDVDGFDIGRVEAVDIAADDVVNDIQRLRIANGTDTANVDFEPFAWHAGCLGDLYARRLALQGVGHGSGAQFLDVVAFDLHHGAGG